MSSILIPADPDQDVSPFSSEDLTQAVVAAVGSPFEVLGMPELRDEWGLSPGLPIVVLARGEVTPDLAPNFRATRLYGGRLYGDVVVACEHDDHVIELDSEGEEAVLARLVSPNEALLALAGAVDGLLVKAVEQLSLVLPRERIEQWLRVRFDHLCEKVREELVAP